MNSYSINKSRIPIIDLNQISDEKQLLPVIKSILLVTDTFLLKNYANKDVLDSLMEQLEFPQNAPDVNQGFDANFTGSLRLDNDIWMEQYILNTDPSLQFNRKCKNVTLQKIYSRLFKINMFFSQLCLKSIVSDQLLQSSLTDDTYATILTRYYHEQKRSNEDENENGLFIADGENFEYLFNREFHTHSSSGILTVFPIAQGIKYKPPTTSSDDNVWTTIDEPDCLLFHTGTLLANWSQGLHSTSPLQLDLNANLVHLTVWPPLNSPLNDSRTIADELLRQQIQEFPEVGTKFYNNETQRIQLEQNINFIRKLFIVAESVISLNAISKSSGVASELQSLLPQMSNMMTKKISQDDFLKILTIWPECYIVEANSLLELTVQLPERNSLMVLTNKSRRLEFVERCETWLREKCSGASIPNDIPPYRIIKRRSSLDDNEGGSSVDEKRMEGRKLSSHPSKTKNYIHNYKEQFLSREKKNDSQSNLLERLRERERKSAALLSQRQRNYQQFLAIKMTQVFDILVSLQWGQPYTVTHLSSLIVDSLQDSNNPIGDNEAEEILDKLQYLLSDIISVHIVDGGLKVYRWDQLDKNKFQTSIQEYRNDRES